MFLLRFEMVPGLSVGLKFTIIGENVRKVPEISPSVKFPENIQPQIYG